MATSTLKVLIRNRDGILFQGECLSISSFNKLGQFDILPMHANFITLVEKEISLKIPGAQDATIAVDNGVCKVRDDKVTIFLGIKEEIKRGTS